MCQKLLVFSLAFWLGLISLQFYKLGEIKPDNEITSQNTIADLTTKDNSQPVQTTWLRTQSYSSSFNGLVRSFQNAVAEDDKKAVVSLINFPVEVCFIDKKNKPFDRKFKNKSELLRNYSKVFDDSFKKNISQIETDRLLYSTGGEVFTRGNEIRMEHFDRTDSADFKVKIIRLCKE